jgi:hypothetical protein
MGLTGIDSVNCKHLAQQRDQWWPIAKAVTNIRISQLNSSVFWVIMRSEVVWNDILTLQDGTDK